MLSLFQSESFVFGLLDPGFWFTGMIRELSSGMLILEVNKSESFVFDLLDPGF